VAIVIGSTDGTAFSMPRWIRVLVFAAVTLSCTAAHAQISISDYNIRSARQERIDDHHFVLTGSVELERGDTSIYADQVDYYDDRNLLIARGNVVFSQGTSRIAADSAEFNTRTALGTFYHASGIAAVQPPRAASGPAGGIVVPVATGLDTDVYFFGEKIEKLGTKKYRISNGGFSTCVQPTPRWDLSADTVVLNIDDYTLLRQALFKVKGVPMLYLPIMYYPTKEEGRATGFLLPTYGSSTLRGPTFHNAFFWAINRSQDATFFHDWYSKTGSGGGVEYRYNMGGGSDGTITGYRLDDRATSYQTGSGITTLPAGTSFTLRGGANQRLPGRMYARGRVDYFSSLITNQTLNTDLANTSTNNRSYGANVVGAWRSYSLNGTFDRSEWFQSETNSGVSGSSPRIALSRNERPIYTGSPVYFSVAGEFAHLDRQTIASDVIADDRSLTRLDFSPQVRYPFKRWQFFTVNMSASWRETYYSRSLDLTATPPTPVDVGLNRSYATVQAQAVGPVFMRIWNTPDSGYAERFKHSIEPYLTIQRTTSIESRAQIVQIDGIDSPYGNTTQVVYGLNNRLYARRKTGAPYTQAQEIAALEVSQTYYSNPAQSLADPRYSTSYSAGTPSNFSAVSVNARVTPTTGFNTSLRGEIDSRHKKLRTLSVNTNYNWSQRLQTSVGWSRSFFIADLPGFNNSAGLNNYLNVSANGRTRDNKYGLNTSFSYDVLRSTMTQQRISAFYNAQCCGIAFELQRYTYPASYVLPSDNRFFLSVSLAGLGNFSPFSGGLNGVPR
jgi:LPS-assembly protein